MRCCKERSLLKDLTEKNVYRQTDYLAFLVTLKQEGLLLRQLDIQFRNDHGTLNYLCGIVDTGATLLADPGIELQTLPDIGNSVFFRQYHLDSLKLRNTRSLIDFSYRPKASLYADGGWSSSLMYEPYKNFGVSFGFTVTMPIYDGHQRKMQYSKLDIAERTRTGYKDFFTSQYNQQIAQLSQQLKATEDLIGQIDEQVRYSQALIDVNGKLLGTGDAKIADYILALGNYLNAKNLLTQNNDHPIADHQSNQLLEPMKISIRDHCYRNDRLSCKGRRRLAERIRPRRKKKAPGRLRIPSMRGRPSPSPASAMRPWTTISS